VTGGAVARYLAALNTHDPDAIAACVTDDFFNEHTSALGDSTHGRAAYRTRLPGFLAEFPDLRYDVEDVVVDGDRAAAAYTMTGRWRGRRCRRYISACRIRASRRDGWRDGRRSR